MLCRLDLDSQLSRCGAARRGTAWNSHADAFMLQLSDVLTAQQEADSSRPGTFMSQ